MGLASSRVSFITGPGGSYKDLLMDGPEHPFCCDLLFKGTLKLKEGKLDSRFQWEEKQRMCSYL